MWFLGGMGPLLRDMWREGNSEQEQVVQAEKLFGRGVPILHITELRTELQRWSQGEKECQLLEQTREQDSGFCSPIRHQPGRIPEDCKLPWLPDKPVWRSVLLSSWYQWLPSLAQALHGAHGGGAGGGPTILGLDRGQG